MTIKEVIDVGQAHQMAEALADVLPARVKAPFTPAFVRSARLYDEFIHRLVFSVFRASDLAAAVVDVPSTVDEIVARAGFEAGRARVPVEWILRRLTHRGILEQTDGDGARFRARGVVPELDPAAVLEEQRRQDPSWLPSYVLAATVAQDYPAFLRGERTGEEILFSPARLRLWVDFFSNDNGLYAVNNLVGAGAVEEWMPPAPVAILELGGGLGSGAAALLDRLRRAGRWADIGEYRFTELVPFFLRRGQTALQTRFPDASFMQYGTLDMNRAFAEQGVAPESVSLVYAVNTLHVARDLDFTAREIYQALAPGGRLVVSECIRTTPAQAVYVEFIFNLMETFRSPVLHATYRPNGGFLTPEQWLGAMRGAGFADVAILPDIAALRDRFPDFNVGAVTAGRPGKASSVTAVF
jgi:SAM-dependent methyltransferase